MKRLVILFVFLVFLSGQLSAAELTDFLNKINIGKISQQILSHQYDSHGCFHFYPTDIYIIYHILPDYSKLEIKKYHQKTPEELKKLPFAVDLVKTKQDLYHYRKVFQNNRTRVTAYPHDKLWIIYNQDKPVFKMKVLPGPYRQFYLAYNCLTPSKISFDPSLSHKTTPGTYFFLGRDKNYYTPYYRNTTIIPMGAKIRKTSRGYIYYKNNKAYPVPEEIQKDLAKKNNVYNYFNIKRGPDGSIGEAYWGSHDFGKYVIFWSKDKKNILSEMGYATGEILFEQIVFLQELSRALALYTIYPSKSYFLKGFADYNKYQKAKDFLDGNPDYYIKNKIVSLYIKMLSGKQVSYSNWEEIPGYITAAYKLYYFPEYPLTSKEKKSLADIGLTPEDKYKIFGIEREMKLYKVAVDKIITKFDCILRNWDYFKTLGELFRENFNENHEILQLDKREKFIYNILKKRFQLYEITEKDTVL